MYTRSMIWNIFGTNRLVQTRRWIIYNNCTHSHQFHHYLPIDVSTNQVHHEIKINELLPNRILFCMLSLSRWESHQLSFLIRTRICSANGICGNRKWWAIRIRHIWYSLIEILKGVPRPSHRKYTLTASRCRSSMTNWPRFGARKHRFISFLGRCRQCGPVFCLSRALYSLYFYVVELSNCDSPRIIMNVKTIWIKLLFWAVKPVKTMCSHSRNWRQVCVLSNWYIYMRSPRITLNTQAQGFRRPCHINTYTRANVILKDFFFKWW